MNYHRSDAGNTIFVGMLIATGFFLFLIWKFSGLFGLDFHTGLAVFLRLLVWTLLLAASWWFGDVQDIEQVRLGNTWPILLATFSVCWWPALKYWSMPFHMPTNFFGEQDFRLEGLYPHSDPVWWATWYTRYGVFFGCLGLGYLIKKFFDHRN